MVVPFGTSSALSSSQADHGSSDNRCVFIISYDLVNTGKAPLAAASLGAVVRAQGNVLAGQAGLPKATLAPHKSEQVRFSGLLPVGSYPIEISLDEEKKAPDANRANNIVSVNIDLQGNCVTGGTSMEADLTSTTVFFGGKHCSDPFAKNIPGTGLGLTFVLDPKNAYEPFDGGLKFNVVVAIGNYGNVTIPKNSFDAELWTSTGVRVGWWGNLPWEDLEPGIGNEQRIATCSYLPFGEFDLKLVLDGAKKVKDFAPQNNVRTVHLILNEDAPGTP